MLSLVTGGAGFLGSHLVDALVAEGGDVIVADNLSTGSLAFLEDSLRGGRSTFVYLDVAQPLAQIRTSILQAAHLNPIDRIFHFASPASPATYEARPWETLCVNGLGTMSLIDLAIEQGARLIFASTSEVYSDPLIHPQPESYFGSVDPIGPRACYDEGKRFGEAAISVAVARRGLDGRIVRFFNCYGPRMPKSDGSLIAALAKAAAAEAPLPIHGDGLQTRALTFVDDAIRLVLMVASEPQAKLEPINIGSDDERTVLDIAETFARAAGTPFIVEHLARRPGDPRRRRPDLTKARALGYVPRTTLDDGLAKTIAWMRDSAGVYV